MKTFYLRDALIASSAILALGAPAAFAQIAAPPTADVEAEAQADVADTVETVTDTAADAAAPVKTTVLNVQSGTELDAPREMVLAKTSNIREGAGTSNPVALVKAAGERVTVFAKTDNWSRISPQGEAELWIYSSLLEAGAETTSVAEADTTDTDTGDLNDQTLQAMTDEDGATIAEGDADEEDWSPADTRVDAMPEAKPTKDAVDDTVEKLDEMTADAAPEADVQ